MNGAPSPTLPPGWVVKANWVAVPATVVTLAFGELATPCPFTVPEADRVLEVFALVSE